MTTEPAPGDTPKTNLQVWWHDATESQDRAVREMTGEHVRADFARELERKLAAVTQVNERLWKQIEEDHGKLAAEQAKTAKLRAFLACVHDVVENRNITGDEWRDILKE